MELEGQRTRHVATGRGLIVFVPLLLLGAIVHAAPFDPAAFGLVEESSLSEHARDALRAERDFALQSENEGMRAAFARWLLPDAAVFGPSPGVASDFVASLPLDVTRQPALRWAPERIVMAQGGDLAFITGPWHLTRPGEEHPATFGQYSSLWKRTPEGWRVVADIGSTQSEPTTLPERAYGRDLVVTAPRIMMILDPMQIVRSLEDALVLASREKGWGAALVDVAHPAVQILRDGRPARVGREALEELVEEDALAAEVDLVGAEISSTGDLAAGWGSVRFGETHPASFLHVWQREGTEWELIADVKLPQPTTPED